MANIRREERDRDKDSVMAFPDTSFLSFSLYPLPEKKEREIWFCAYHEEDKSSSRPFVNLPGEEERESYERRVILHNKRGRKQDFTCVIYLLSVSTIVCDSLVEWRGMGGKRASVISHIETNSLPVLKREN